MATASATLSSLSSLSLHTTTNSLLSLSKPKNPFFTKPIKPSLLHHSFSSNPTTFKVKSSEIDTTFFDNFNPNDESDTVFNPPEPPEGFIAPPSFDDGPLEAEEDIAAAYEELYGPAYSGESYLGNDIYVMDSKVRKSTGFGSKTKKEKVKDGFEERVIQVRRVTKVVKGGKQMHFRAIVVVGDKQGQVGVGVGKAKEVVGAVQKSAVNARRNIVSVPMTKYLTFPHR
jgi:small subunit ribosomal protein S5